MFDYDLTLVKCGKAASPGQYCLYLRVENYEDTNPAKKNMDCELDSSELYELYEKHLLCFLPFIFSFQSPN